MRAQVELQTRQQQLIAARNDFAKQKLSLARVIGLPPGQKFLLTEKAPYQALTPLPVDVYLQQAYTSRSDYQAAQAQVRAAELSRRAATAGHYPTLEINANYGDIGVTPAQSNGTWQVNGGIEHPHLRGRKNPQRRSGSRCSIEAGAFSAGRLARAASIMRSAPSLLDLNSAAEQVEVARSSVELAERPSPNRSDRFAAGVTDNLEVVQAQESRCQRA